MTGSSHLARVSLFGLLLMLAACGTKNDEIKTAVPGPRPDSSCDAFTGREQRQAVAELAKIFHSPANGRAMALAALALTDKLPVECLQFVEQQISGELGK